MNSYKQEIYVTKYISNGHYSAKNIFSSDINNGVADDHDVEMELTKVHDLISEEADNHRAKLKNSIDESLNGSPHAPMSTFNNMVMI